MEFKERLQIGVTHVQQRFDWDCGIACLLMVLSLEQRNAFLENFQQICADEGFKKSVWTIDLAYLLHRFHISCIYCTITLGVDSDYAHEGYYASVLPMDSSRICQRFQLAPLCNVHIEKRHVSLDEILAHLETEKLCIALVNSNLLNCTECKLSLCETAACNLFSSGCFKPSSTYNGHFIVLCGYDLTQEEILYRNPANQDRVCSASFETFESARSSFGTDEDIIFINKPVDEKG